MLETILCVDDDPITLMLCKMVITKSSFSNKIDTAKNGEEALKYFDSLLLANNYLNKPQLIFLDLNMPIIDGWEFLDHFNTLKYSDFHQIKVIILSSTIDPEDLKNQKNIPW